MGILIVTYDLRGERSSAAYQKVLEVIRQYNHVQLSESTYAIETWKAVSDLYLEFHGTLDSNDTLLIFAAKKPYAGWHGNNTLAWLELSMTY